ncbi:hypothetical protein IAQ61_003638 [Plenodomus lingam]|uniref:uncharacterized protein n=1 Tax=Leptosphaeria maculans TaxID=5022 RepID=UPI0033316EFA|nr:hypothetical protein IAQ61_003638 [Plenodomus lingam]
MPTSVSNAAKPRVQKVCTLWTHDDNFSREDIVFNREKFPELPTAPGSLLQIVAIKTGTAVRGLQGNASGTPNHASQTEPDASTLNVDPDGHAKRDRRGSITITVDEAGGLIPEGREVDAEKAYIFVSKQLPVDLKAKHTNLQVSRVRNAGYIQLNEIQVSISERIAKVFGFRNRMQVIVTEVSVAEHPFLSN